ncbi:MAG: cupin domain-containing protein [Leucobacter sp.]
MSTGSHGEVQLENEHFRVTKWTIDPGGVIPMHRHDHEYVVVPLTTETMHVTNADGSEIVASLVEGQSYTRPGGAEHRVENRGSDEPVVFVEVEKLS